jgi:biopolymer transport protein ExbD
MKLETTIRVRPDFLYLAPLLNVVLLLMVFFLLNSNLVVRSGMRVDLPTSGSSVKVNEHAHIVTITGDNDSKVLLNNQEISVGDLAAKLEGLKKISRDVVVNADSHAPVGLLWRVREQIHKAGCYPNEGARAESD